MERVKARMESVRESRLSLSHVIVKENRRCVVEASSVLSTSLSGLFVTVCSPSPKSGVSSEACVSGSSGESRCAVWTEVWDMMEVTDATGFKKECKVNAFRLRGKEFYAKKLKSIEEDMQDGSPNISTSV